MRSLAAKEIAKMTDSQVQFGNLRQFSHLFSPPSKLGVSGFIYTVSDRDGNFELQ